MSAMPMTIPIPSLTPNQTVSPSTPTLSVSKAWTICPQRSLNLESVEMGNQISIGEADLLLEKLYSEAIPVVAYYARDGVKVMRHGVITGVSTELGLVVADKESVPLYDYLAVSVPAGCTFWYGVRRELPDEARAERVEHLGDAVV